MSIITFSPRWREELVAVSKEGTLIFEFTMGKYHVYFPSELNWEKTAPDWAREKWKYFFEECSRWCSINKIPITIVNDALFYEEKSS